MEVKKMGSEGMGNTLCLTPSSLPELQLCPSAPLDLRTMLKSSGAAPGQVWAGKGPLHLKVSAALISPPRAGLGSAPGKGPFCGYQGIWGPLLNLNLLGHHCSGGQWSTSPPSLGGRGDEAPSLKSSYLRPSPGGTEQLFGKPSPRSSGGTEPHTAVGVSAEFIAAPTLSRGAGVCPWCS